jgi:hypothetical protein
MVFNVPNFTQLSVSEYRFMKISCVELHSSRTNNVANRAKHYLRLLETHVIHCIDFHEIKERKYVFILSVRYFCSSLPTVEIFRSTFSTTQKYI